MSAAPSSSSTQAAAAPTAASSSSSSSSSSDAQEWTPTATIEDLYAAAGGNQWSAINAPTAGARNNDPLPVSAGSGTSAPIQLYSLSTPNGQKVGIVLEELGLEYDAHVVNISKGSQFSGGFVAVNPNSKIPSAVDRNGPDGKPINLFESANICLYFADKHAPALSFRDQPRLRAELMNWVFWQMAGQGPMTGNFGHFFVYAPATQIEARNYGVARYGMEVQRLTDVLDKALEGKQYLVGDTYSVADMIIFPWFRALLVGYKHAKTGRTAREFLQVDKYKNACAWAERIGARPAVVRGLQVCNWNGEGKPWLSKASEAKL